MLIKIGAAFLDPDEIQTVTPDRNEEHKQICVGLKGGLICWIEGTMDEAEAALIDAGVMIDPAADPKENETPGPEMDAEERYRLEDLDADGYRYLARDKDGKLYAFRRKPVFEGFYWSDPGPGNLGAVRVTEAFLSIGQDEEKPTEISRLLNE